MTWNPKTWNFKTWFVLLFSVVLLGIAAGVWVVRGFDDALRVAGVSLPAIVAAVLAWGLSEISRQEERKSQDRRLQDDRGHERALRRQEIAEREIVDWRAFQRRTLEDLGPAVDAYTGTASHLTEFTFHLLDGTRRWTLDSVQEINASKSLLKTQIDTVAGLITRLEDDSVKDAAIAVVEPMGEAVEFATGWYERTVKANMQVDRNAVNAAKATALAKINDVAEAQGTLLIHFIGPHLRMLYRPILTATPPDEAPDTPAPGH